MNDSPTTKRHDKPAWIIFIKELYQVWLTERPTQLAAALAYFGLFSFAPVIYIALAVAGIFVDKSSILDQLLERVESAFGAGVAQTIQDMLNNISPPGSEGSFLISVISLLLLLLTASGVFYQLQFALNTIWKVPRTSTQVLQRTLRERLFSFLMVIGMGLLLVLAAAVSLLTSWISSKSILPSLLPSLTFFGFIALATLTFGVMYKLLPAVKIAWRDVWIGALVAASLVTIGGMVIVFFIDNSSVSSALEAAGAFIILLTGFYYFSQIFLLGSIITRIYAHRRGSMRQQEFVPNQEEAEN
jgi:membrane protein